MNLLNSFTNILDPNLPKQLSTDWLLVINIESCFAGCVEGRYSGLFIDNNFFSGLKGLNTAISFLSFYTGVWPPSAQKLVYCKQYWWCFVAVHQLEIVFRSAPSRSLNFDRLPRS